MANDSIHQLPVDQLEPNPFQPRDTWNDAELSELADSIRSVGVLEPLVVAHTPAGYQIIAGERRWRAAIKAGLATVPAVVRKTSPRGMLEMALVENVQRVDLHPLERAKAFKQLIQDFGFSNQQVAQRVGKSSSYVSNSLRLLELPDAIQDGLLGNQISEGHARALASIEDERDMVECYKVVLRESASVRRTEELARRYREEQRTKLTNYGRPLLFNDERTQLWQKNLKAVLHTDAKLKVSRSSRQTRITIVLKGSPTQTEADVERIMSFAGGQEEEAA